MGVYMSVTPATALIQYDNSHIHITIHKFIRYTDRLIRLAMISRMCIRVRKCPSHQQQRRINIAIHTSISQCTHRYCDTDRLIRSAMISSICTRVCKCPAHQKQRRMNIAIYTSISQFTHGYCYTCRLFRYAKAFDAPRHFIRQDI